MEETKTCTKCGKTKKLSHYSHNKRSKDGYHSECKECANRRRTTARINRRKIKITDVKCTKCKETYPSPFMAYTYSEYSSLKEEWEKFGTCQFCIIKEKYADTIKKQKQLFGQVVGYICPNPECKTIHFYNPRIPKIPDVDIGYLYNEPEEKIKKVHQTAPNYLGHITSKLKNVKNGQEAILIKETSVEKRFLQCKVCGRAYLESNWKTLEEDQIYESHYRETMAKLNPEYAKYCNEMEGARKTLIEIKDFNCSQNGVCGVLQAHHTSLIYDDQRLTTEFMLGLISTEAKEDYIQLKKEEINGGN